MVATGAVMMGRGMFLMGRGMFLMGMSLSEIWSVMSPVSWRWDQLSWVSGGRRRSSSACTRQMTSAVVSSPRSSRSNLAVARSASAVGSGVGGNGKQTT